MNTVALTALRVGQDLPVEVIAISTRMVVGTAIATRDFQDVHHDSKAACDAGVPDVFMNILTTNALVGRYVTDWAGPHARICKIDVKLGAPNFPGDSMTLAGSVQSIDTDSGRVVVAVVGNNQLGSHVIGSVTLVLPTPAAHP